MFIKKINYESLFVLFVCFSLFTVFAVGVGDCEQSYLYVTINADGTISPETAPITKEAKVYTLTDDVDAITISRSNMVLDGNGYTLTGNGKTMAVYVGSKNVTIMNLKIIGAELGIALDNCSSNVTISNNIIRDVRSSIPELYQYAAIDLWGGGNHTIIGDCLENNYIGVGLGYNTTNNLIVGNNITNNNRGLEFWTTSNNTIHHNNIINNTIQFYNQESSSSNVWNDTTEGNYWNTYNGTDSDGDGVGDQSYILDENNQDNHPLMNPVDITTIPEFSLWTVLALMVVVALMCTIYRKTVNYQTTKTNSKH